MVVVSIHNQPKQDQSQGSPNNSADYFLPWYRLSQLRLDGDDTAHSHDPHEPGEHQVGDSETIPDAVVEEVVAAAAIIDKDHDSDSKPAEYVQTCHSCL